MPTAINILGVIELLGVIQAALFGSLLIFRGRGHRPANRLLGLMLYLLGGVLLHQFFIDTQILRALPWLAGFTMPLEAFFAPLLYRYVQVLTDRDPSTRLLDRIKHFVLPVLSFLVAVPFFFLPVTTRLNIVEAGYAPATWDGIAAWVMPVQMMLFALSFSLYLGLALYRLYRHRRAVDDYFSYRERVTLAWLRNLLVVMVVFWCLMSAFMTLLASASAAQALLVVLMIVTVIAIHYMGIMGLLQPPIFPVPIHTVPIYPAKEASEPPAAQSSADDALDDKGPRVQSKYEHSGLTSEDLDRIATKLRQLMERDACYLQGDLALPQLAAMIGVSPNYLSQVINDRFQVNFFEFVNAYRIRRAQELLVDAAAASKTVLEIAMDCGFNSKSAFYSAFKKQVGMSPAQFRKSAPN